MFEFNQFFSDFKGEEIKLNMYKNYELSCKFNTQIELKV